jgi:hypothetical protein
VKGQRGSLAIINQCFIYGTNTRQRLPHHCRSVCNIVLYNHFMPITSHLADVSYRKYLAKHVNVSRTAGITLMFAGTVLFWFLLVHSIIIGQ